MCLHSFLSTKGLVSLFLKDIIASCHNPPHTHTFGFIFACASASDKVKDVKQHPDEEQSVSSFRAHSVKREETVQAGERKMRRKIFLLCTSVKSWNVNDRVVIRKTDLCALHLLTHTVLLMRPSQCVRLDVFVSEDEETVSSADQQRAF